MSTPAATILIVDDEIRNRKLLELLLQHEGYNTMSAASGDEALAMLEHGAPDLILLDVMMPTLDGYQVARIIKAHPLSSSIPIIMISAHSDRTSRLAGLNAGAEEFLTKPIDRDELWLRVRNLLRLKTDGDLIRNNSALLEERIQTRTVELQRFRTAMDATADVLTLTDRGSMRHIEVNAAACSLLGYTREEFLSMDSSQLNVDELEPLEQVFDAIIAGGNDTGQLRETTLRRKDGSHVSVEVSRKALQTGDDWTIVSVWRDITERKEAQARLQQLAHYDPLTGLPNRRLFQESLTKAIEHADLLERQVVLLYMDLDNFKDVNDSLGHSCGDQLLREFSERLLASLYPRDTVGRLGGDEFGIILLTPRDPEIGMLVANRIHDVLRAHFDLNGHSIRASVSIGITIYPSDTTDAEMLARFADLAMYEAKRSGRNASRFYTAAMNQRVSEKLELVTALRGALSRDEFVLYYQPKVSLRTGRWTGVEALLRWKRPDHGLVPPDVFIPALEESGLIVPVGAWTIATACKQLADWHGGSMDGLSIAVNVSALQLVPQHSPNQIAQSDRPAVALDGIEMLSAVSACLGRHKFAAGLLEFELTESVVMADAEHSIEILRRLGAMGIGVSVDDFGTGYSSLSYLRRLPLETLKIDGSFVRDVSTGGEDGSIAVAIIEMAHRLNLKVIAECVETDEQVHFLQAHGCDEAQGYHFAKPMPVAELESLWQTGGGSFAHLASMPINLHERRLLVSAWPEFEEFSTALLAGSRDKIIALVDRKLAEGHGIVDISRQLIQPALYRIGEKWREKQIGIPQEHMATALALSVMAYGLSRSPLAPPNGRKVMLACVEANQHTVGLQMVADAFTIAGWEVNFLGANVPLQALIDFAKFCCPDLIALSASLPEHVGAAREFQRRLKEAMGSDCPHVLIGGMGFRDSDMRVQADNCDVRIAHSAASAVTAGHELCMGDEAFAFRLGLNEQARVV